MKSYVTFFLIAIMSIGLVFLLVTRERSKHDTPAEILEPTVTDGGVEAGTAEGGVAVASAEGGAPAKPADKPLRIVSLGWDLAAAAAAMTLPDGGAPAGPMPPIEIAPEPSLDAVEARLARGGNDPLGADIAIVPLPAFVASFERLRALEPRAFLVIGFSRGREEVHAAPGALLKAPPAADEVKLVALGPASALDPAARAAGSESATLLGLFALDQLGVAGARVRIVAPGTPDAKAALVGATIKGAADERKIAFSTADASRFVPIVAVAPKGVIDAREPALREWSKAWLDALGKTKSDVPGAARRLAGKEALPFALGVGGAPEALVLVERLGQIENAALDQQTSLIGPLAKGAVTLDALALRTWQLARGGGLTAGAAPEPLPIDTRIVTSIAPPPKSTPAPAPDPAAPLGTIPTGSVPLLTYRAVEGDADKVAAQIFFLSGIFERASFKITAKGGAKAALAIGNAARDKGVASARLATAAAEPAGTFATVEILAPP